MFPALGSPGELARARATVISGLLEFAGLRISRVTQPDRAQLDVESAERRCSGDHMTAPGGEGDNDFTWSCRPDKRAPATSSDDHLDAIFCHPRDCFSCSWDYPFVVFGFLFVLSRVPTLTMV